jgi:predicted permease
MTKKRRSNEDFQAEIESHIAHETDRLIAEGKLPADARAAARRAFGNVTRARERFHETNRWVWFDQFRQDLRLAVRGIANNPLFSAVAIISLAFGIGANTALFSMVHALLIKALPYRAADRLVYVTEFWPHEPVVPGPPGPDFANWRANSKLVDGIAAYGGFSEALNFTGEGEPERILPTMVTASFLDLIGSRLALGRNFTPEEDWPGGRPAVILGYNLWQRRFGASAEVIGKTIQINGSGRTIAGVLPAGFAFPDNNFRNELLVPMALAADLSWHDAESFRLLRVMARLKPGVSPLALKNEFSSIVRATASQEPPQMVTMRKDMEVRILPLRDWLTGGVRQLLLVLQATLAILLLIACLNIASLQAARATSRRKEVALRAALGAGRGRLIRQLLTESMMLSILGGLLGTILGYGSLSWLRGFLPANLHLADSVQLDGTVLGFTFAIAVLTGILVGTAPALALSHPRLQTAIQEGHRPSQDKQRLQGALVIAEVALTIVLLVGAGLFVRTFVRLASADPGFRLEGVLSLRVSLPQNKYPDRKSWIAFFSQVLDRARAIPGVEFAAAGGGLPVIGTRSLAGVSIEDQPLPPLGGRPSIPVAGVSADYFRALGIPILRGRGFTNADGTGPLVAVVNQVFAERFFPGEDALGKRIEVASREGLWREIVGIAGNVTQQQHRPVDPFIVYQPLSQMPESEELVVLKSSSIPTERLATALIAAVHAVDPNQPVFDIATMEERLGSAISPQRANMMLMGVFAVLALILATIGVFGGISFFVNRRVHDIGIRMALGAKKSDVLGMILCRGLGLAGVGIGLGIAGALVLTRNLVSLVHAVFGITS